MEVGTKINFDNKVAQNFFKFLSREVYSQSIDDFEALKFVLKVMTLNKSKTIVSKYICLFFDVIKNLVSNHSNISKFQVIINEALSSILNTKQVINLIV
jgi:hypothetical protein